MIYDKHNKVFLNERSDEYGSICWYTSIADYATAYRPDRKEDRLPARNAELRISDCTNNITLDFYYNTHKTFNERLTKLDTLITEMLSFREVLIESSKLDVKFEDKPNDDTLETKTEEQLQVLWDRRKELQ